LPARTRYTRQTLVAVASVLVVIATAVVQAVGIAPAAAVTIPVGSVEVVTAASGFSVGSSKTLSAVCPAARPRVLGGGFTTTGTHIVVNELRPVSGSPVDSYQVTAGFDAVGTSASWQLLVYAYCSSVAPGWELATATTTTTSDPSNAVNLTCPGTKRLVGTGGRINGGAGQVQLETLALGLTAPNTMSAGGLEQLGGFAGLWNATAYAVCVNVTNLLDIVMVPNQTAINPTNPKGVTATCPSGMRLTGSAINLRPNSATPTSVTATARDDSGSGFSWDLNTYALCAK